MKNLDFIKIIGILVFLAGIIVMVGWIQDIEMLKSILPGLVTMKVTTAICFIMTGIIIYFSACSCEDKNELAGIIIPAAALIILITMGLLLLSNIFGVRTGIEDLFIKETTTAVKTSTPGRPSIATMIEFLLIAVAGIMSLGCGRKKCIGRIGIIISAIGAIGAIGYLLNIPELYYNIPGFSTSMALHTAILFVLSGIAFMLICKEKGDKK
jgi:hypothetical protein